MTMLLPAALGNYKIPALDPASLSTDLWMWLDNTTSVLTRETSASLDGSSQYLTVPDSSDFDFGSGEFTIAIWCYPISFNVQHRALASSWKETSDQAWSTLVLQTSGKAYLRVSTDGTTESNLTAGTACSLNAWNSLVFVRDRTAQQIKIAVNGGAFTTTSYSNTNTLHNSAEVMRIGALQGSSSATFFFAGRQEQLGIWKGTAQDSTFVTWWHNSGSGRDYSDVASSYSTNLVYYNRLKNAPYGASVGTDPTIISSFGCTDGKTNTDTTAGDNDYAYSWDSKSPATSGIVTQSDSSRRCGYNTTPIPKALLCSNSNTQAQNSYYISTNSVSLGTSWTILSVLKAASNTTGDLMGNATGTNYFKFGMDSSGRLTGSIYNTSNAATSATYTPGVALTSAYTIVHMRSNAGTFYLGQNGIEDGGTATSATPRTGTIQLYLGGSAATGNFIRCELLGHLFIQRNISGSELQGLVEFLRAYWSI